MKSNTALRSLLSFALTLGFSLSTMQAVANTDIANEPLYTSRQVTPLNLLVMGRDHKLYYEAYNDVSDLDGDGVIDMRFKPSITYFGYFNSGTCYTYTNNMFVPVSAALNVKDAGGIIAKPNSCSTANNNARWSGNFLNYIATSRIDALRKVLYGGFRSTDLADTSGNAAQTVLERSYTPQDGHSWGKEYTSLVVDGYDIADYAPLSQPRPGTRHLIANTNLNNNTGTPLIRVLNDSRFRIWEWVSREAPVAGPYCVSDTTSCEVNGTDTTHPANYAEFTALIARFSNQVLSGTPVARTRIWKRANGALALPDSGTASGQADNYISILTGKLNVTTSGTYRFAINGDDGVDFAINGSEVVSWHSSSGHGAADQGASSNNINSNWRHSSAISLTKSTHDIVFRHNEVGGDDRYQLAWQRRNTNGTWRDWEIIPAGNFQDLSLTVLTKNLDSSRITDYQARIQVCKAGILEENCKRYVRTVGANEYESFKPEGILQQYGNNPDAPKMLFGLLTGSHVNNLQGGVLRRAMGNISSEINQQTGQFDTSVNGVIGNINKLKITAYDGSSYAKCGLLARAINNDECHMWGNPIAEMMYEGVRYFAGKTAPTSAFTYSSSTYDDGLNLSKPSSTWVDPYSLSGVQQCSAPVQTVISDINPSYDTDQLPGSYWNEAFTSDLTVPMNVGTLADKIWGGEYGAGKSIFIGETNNVVTSGPTAKTANTFKNTRGLAPEEPTKRGGYYAASVAHYGWLNDLNPRSGDQKLSTYAIALASPLPEFRIPVGNNIVTLVPFGKSVKNGDVETNWITYAPTNTIVDFYVESMSDDGREGVFRVNFEDVEQGNDHDMDAIVRYTYRVNNDNTLTIDLESQYAAGSVVQHMGYVISGTTRDGVYLEVRDVDTTEAKSPLYVLDTPPGVWAGGARGNAKLPLTASRTFSPSSTPAATLLKNPLWYAAKWGGFKDRNGNGIPDLKEEWTSSTAESPDPDNYFLVTNALKLGEQLDKAFSEILRSLSSSSAAAASTGEFVSGKSQVVQARFRTDNWSGELVSYAILDNSNVGAISWNSAERLPVAANRNIFTLSETATASGGVPFTWSTLNAAQQASLQAGSVTAAVAEQRLSYLRGDASREERNGGAFRNRVNGALGDIINSDPVYVDNLESTLITVPEADREAYASFRAGLSSRPEMVYAGTNGGLLHAVCADECGAAVPKGQEVFAYVPNALFPNLYELTLPAYSHRYYVDGPITVTDSKTADGWKTILLGALGAGGKGLYALDVTTPQNFDEGDVLWELTAAHEAQQLGVDPLTETDLGYTIGKPQIVRLKGATGSVAIVSNGFNGASGYASLLIIDVATGDILKRLRVSGSGSGLASPAVYDRDSDGYVDYVYAGDDAGKLWRFDLTGASSADWKVDLNGVALFDAGSDQPITSAPLVYHTTDEDGETMTMVYVGTGRYLGQTDKRDTRTQAMYAIRDKWFGSNTLVSPVTITSLLQQRIELEVDNPTLVGGTAGYAVRVTSADTVDYESQDGWYLSLLPPHGNRQGERIVATPAIRHGRLIFTTLIPQVDSCEFGGSSWLMEMEAISGARFANSVLDINNDGKIDADDMLQGNEEQWAIGGRKFNELIRSPAFVGFDDKEAKYISGSSGGLTKVWEEGGKTSEMPRGRLSWRQLE